MLPELRVGACVSFTWLKKNKKTQSEGERTESFIEILVL